MGSRIAIGVGIGVRTRVGIGIRIGFTPPILSGSTEAFSPERGGRADATRLMIVVTDGESHDGEELPEALAECEKRNVTRYAIAVSALATSLPASQEQALCLCFPIPLYAMLGWRTPILAALGSGSGLQPMLDPPLLRCWGTTSAGSRTLKISSVRSSTSPATQTRSISSTSLMRPPSTTLWTPWATASSAWKVMWGQIWAWSTGRAAEKTAGTTSGGIPSPSPTPGTHGYNESSFELEMSQIGFSLHLLEVRLLEWAGSSPGKGWREGEGSNCLPWGLCRSGK